MGAPPAVAFGDATRYAGPLRAGKPMPSTGPHTNGLRSQHTRRVHLIPVWPWLYLEGDFVAKIDAGAAEPGRSHKIVCSDGTLVMLAFVPDGQGGHVARMWLLEKGPDAEIYWDDGYGTMQHPGIGCMIRGPLKYVLVTPGTVIRPHLGE